MKKLILCFVMMSVVACVSKEKKAVNDQAPMDYVPVMAGVGLPSGELVADALRTSSKSALEGQLLLDGAIPTPLVHVQLILLKKEDGQWKELGRLTTENGGHFSFTQKLTAGDYEIRIQDKKYKGTLAVRLDSDPQRELVILAK